MIKLIVCVKRHPSLSVAAWRKHMREVHGPLVRDHPVSRRYLRGYVQGFTADAEYDRGEPAYDGTSELWFDTLADKDAWLADPRYQADIFPDGAEHADMGRTAFFATTSETVV